MLAVLEAVDAWERKAEHGWVLDEEILSLCQSVHRLEGQALVEAADRQTRAELSAWEGRPVRRAVRLAPRGTTCCPVEPRARRGPVGAAAGGVDAVTGGRSARVRGFVRPFEGAARDGLG